jgi:PhnB protein
MQNLGIYLVMNGNCEEAFTYYQSVFGGTLAFSRFKDGPQSPNGPKINGELIMNVTFKTENFEIMGCDMPDYMKQPLDHNSFNIILNASSKEQADQYYNGLLAGSQVLMPLENTFWGAYFGMLKDKFGVQWMVSYTII